MDILLLVVQKSKRLIAQCGRGSSPCAIINAPHREASGCPVCTQDRMRFGERMISLLEAWTAAAGVDATSRHFGILAGIAGPWQVMTQNGAVFELGERLCIEPACGCGVGFTFDAKCPVNTFEAMIGKKGFGR